MIALSIPIQLTENQIVDNNGVKLILLDAYNNDNSNNEAYTHNSAKHVPLKWDGIYNIYVYTQI